MRRLGLLLALGLWACEPASDAGDDDLSGDAGTVQLPDGAPACTPSQVLPQNWRPVDKVSAGQITSVAGAITTTSIDATAGGFSGSATEPFLYLSFTGGAVAKVAISDPASYGSNAWDLAFKRYVIRANGGDSGTAKVEVAKVTAASLAAVTVMPAVGDFGRDDFADATCTLRADQLGAPVTAIGEWYTLNNTKLDPKAEVYVVRLRDGKLIKLRIVTYYGDPADPARSGFYKIEWAPL